MTRSVDVRRELAQGLRLDLVGPEPGDEHAAEVLAEAPSAWYRARRAGSPSPSRTTPRSQRRFPWHSARAAARSSRRARSSSWTRRAGPIPTRPPTCGCGASIATATSRRAGGAGCRS